MGIGSFGVAVGAQSTQELVIVDRVGAEDFREPPGPDAAARFHLPQSVLCMDKAEPEVRVG